MLTLYIACSKGIANKHWFYIMLAGISHDIAFDMCHVGYRSI